jgi:Domain of unknown function (DUF4173)
METLMTDSGNAVATNPAVPIRESWPWRIALVVILTALADWLFFRQAIGVSLTLFVLAVAAGVLLANRIDAHRRVLRIYGIILFAALLPSFEDFNAMSALIAVLGIACFALGVTAALKGDLIERVIAVGWFLVSGPFQLVRDLPLLKQWASQRGAPVDLTAAQGWIVPLAFGAVFVALFAAANPLIADWFAQWSLAPSLNQLDMQRLTFWIGTIIVAWAFVHVCGCFAPFDLGLFPTDDEPQPVRATSPDIATGAAVAALSNPIFNDAAVMRSLVLFNLLFAVQSVMDINYLWAGASLPDGMTYATYAHRGAYPLIATALLAAAFVIVAMRPGSAAERSPLMRALVFLWVGQNVLLVVSAMLRLDLYVATYLLTYWRVAAFIWMLLVAAGLILIVVRIVTYRSNAWLISANAVVLVLTIYVCSFVNFANLVASYNVAHARDSASAGHPIDLTYVTALGPQAIPAIDRYLAANPLMNPGYFRRHRDWLAAQHARETRSWRAWTFRGWRLTLYLENPQQP